MTQLFANNAYGSLAATLSNSATSLTLGTGQGARFPTPTGGDYFLLTLVGIDSNTNENAWEIVKVTGRSTDALTIVRAQEGTTAATWASGSHVELRATAGTFDSFTDTAQAAAAAPVQSVAGRTGNVTLTNSDVGLGNVENKSSATIRSELTSGNVTTALGFTPENVANKGAANGYAPLGSDSKIASTYLPSYVDDVLEYANFAALPSIGETGKIYVLAAPYTAAGVTSSQFRWSGSAYAAIIASPGSTDAVTEGSTNLYFTNARAQAALAGMYLPSTGGTLTGDLTFSGTNRRIIGDFTSTSRVLVQTSSANSNTVFGLIPNGTSVNSQFHVWGASDITNAPLGTFTINSSSVQIQSSAAGTGTALPFRVLVSTTEVFRATTGFNFLIGSSVDDGVNKFQLTGSAALTGSLNFTGTGNRITGDFSNATAASRAAFQSSTANGNTLVNLLPNGTATVSRWGAFNGADSANASIVSLGITATAAEIVSTFNGTGTALPLDVYVGGAKQLSIATTGAGTATKDWTLQGVTVGRGGGAVVGNTAVGASALGANTTASSNTAVGYQAGYQLTTGGTNQLFGVQAGYALTTGTGNFLAGYGAGGAITTGSKNTIVGNYNGNQGGLDIRTASNYIVLSDGDGNPRLFMDGTGAGRVTSGNFSVGTNPYAMGYGPQFFFGDGNGGALGMLNAQSINTNDYPVTLTANAYCTGVNTFAYVTSGANASRFRMNQGAITFASADTGTAGSTITFTEVLSVKKGETLALQGAGRYSGTGITFPATQNASSDANTLDDYEEGTWTPNQGIGLTVGGTFVSAGTYTKVGRLVTVNLSVRGTTSMAVVAAGTVCSNLPFAVAGDGIGGYGGGQNNNTQTPFSAYAYGTSVSSVAASSGSGNGGLYITITYMAA